MSNKPKKAQAQNKRHHATATAGTRADVTKSRLKRCMVGALAALAIIPMGTLATVYVTYFTVPEDRAADLVSGPCSALGMLFVTPRVCSASALVGEAREALGRKDKDKTLKLVERALILKPNDANALDLRGDVEMKAGRDDNAEADFGHAIATSALPEAYYHRALLNYKRGRLPAAIGDLDAALRGNPGSADYHVMKAFFLKSRDGQFNETARQELDKATELEPGDSKLGLVKGLSMLGSDPKRAAELATVVIEKNPMFSKAYSLRALYEAAQGQEDLAEKDYNTAIALDGKNVDAIDGIGFIMLIKGQEQDAIASFSKAIDLEPNYDNPIRNRSTAYMRAGRYDEALTDITRAISLNPAEAEYYYDRATIYAARKKAGDIDRGAADYARSLDRDPKFVDSYLGRAELNIDRGDNQAGVEDAGRAIALSKEWKAFALRGIARDNLGMFQEALADFAAAEAGGVKDDLIDIGRGRALLGLGHSEKALQSFEKIVNVSGHTAPLDRLIGAAYFGTGKYDSALQAFLRAEQLAPDADGKTFLNIGMTYLRLAEPDLAIHWLDEAIRRAPKNYEAYHAKGIVLSTKEEWDAAAEAFASAAKLDPQNAEYLSRRASALDHAGRKKEAIDSLNAAVSLRPNDQALRRSRALLYVNNGSLPGDFAAAQKKIDLLDDTDPDKVRMQCFLEARKDDVPAATEVCRAAVRRHPDSADAHYALCAISMDAGNVQQANQECREATRLDPQNARAFAALALAAAWAGDNDGAIKNADHARALTPTLDLAWVALAVAYQARQDWQRAADASQQAIKINNKNVFALILQADSLRRLDRFEEAAVAVKSALALEPANPWLADMQGIMHLQKADPKKAIEDFSEAIRLDANGSVFLVHRAIAYIQLQKDRDAVLDLSSAIRTGFTAADIYNLRSTCEERLGMNDAAADDRYEATHQFVSHDQPVPLIVASEFPLQGLDSKNNQISLGSPVH